MKDFGYLIVYRPYTWEENAKDEMYHAHGEQVAEFFFDDTKFNERLTELQSYSSYWEDGIDIDGIYTCELHKITR